MLSAHLRAKPVQVLSNTSSNALQTPSWLDVLLHCSTESHLGEISNYTKTVRNCLLLLEHVFHEPQSWPKSARAIAADIRYHEHL